MFSATAVTVRTKEVDIDLLEVVYAAELVEFVMNLVVDQRLVVVGRVVTHDVIDWPATAHEHHNNQYTSDFRHNCIGLCHHNLEYYKTSTNPYTY